MFHPVRSITNQLFKAPRIPILKFVRYKPFPRRVTHLQGISPPITDSYSLTRYKTPPLNFSQAVAALRAYSLVDRDEYVNLKLDLNLFDAKKRKQVVQLLSSVIVFPNQFTEESSVFILCSDSEGETARKAGATGYLEERHFNKLESMEMKHDYYLATEAVADAVREMRKVFRHKLPNRKKGSIVQAEQLKEAVHRFLATTTLSFEKLKTDKTMALLDMDFGKVNPTFKHAKYYIFRIG